MANSVRNRALVLMVSAAHQAEKKMRDPTWHYDRREIQRTQEKLRYDDTSPCTRCGSSMEDCDCCTEYELRSSMRSLGLRTEPRPYGLGQAVRYVNANGNVRQLRELDYDLASVNRMLREFGYK